MLGGETMNGFGLNLKKNFSLLERDSPAAAKLKVVEQYQSAVDLSASCGGEFSLVQFSRFELVGEKKRKVFGSGEFSQRFSLFAARSSFLFPAAHYNFKFSSSSSLLYASLPQFHLQLPDCYTATPEIKLNHLLGEKRGEISLNLSTKSISPCRRSELASYHLNDRHCCHYQKSIFSPLELLAARQSLSKLHYFYFYLYQARPEKKQQLFSFN